ncbi:MAG: extracellular solute-binding protein [Cellulosilyticum sp.]|nr:extracellular solute-binding protein [Cellulosilyticum sp.]
MKFKKMLAGLLVTVVMAGAFTGCGNSKTTSAVAEDGKAQISMMLTDFEGSPLSGDAGAKVVAQMEEHTNTHVDFTFVPDDNYEDKLSLTLASTDDMPMIIAVPKMSGVIVGAAEAGAFWDLSDLITDASKYPNLSQANPNVNQSLTIGGKLIGVYKARDIGRYGFGYRKDWADKLGIDEPKTIEDMYDMMYQFTYNDPDGNGKDDTYGVSLCKYTGPFDIMQTWFGCGNGWVEQNGELVPVHQTQEYKEALDWFKKMYEDGLVYEDWAVRDTATWQDTVKNGECGIFIDVLDGARRVGDYFVNENIPSVTDSNELASMKLVGTINDKTLATTGYNGFFVITKAADTQEKVEACLHFLDKMCDDEMITLAGYGLENEHWKLGEDGFLVDLDEGDVTSSKAYSALNQAIAYIPRLVAESPALKLTERKEEENAVKAANVDYAVFNPATSYLVNSSTYSLAGTTLDKMLDDARTQYICGQIDEAGLQGQWDLWLKQGGQDVINEVNEQFKANK